VNADSTSPSGARWTLVAPAVSDTALVGQQSGGSLLEPHGSSATRQLGFRVPPGVSEVRLTLHGSGRYVFSVPTEAPHATAASVIAEAKDSTHYAYYGKSRLARDKIWVAFMRDATLEDRQATIDAIGATVIGGGLGQYYLRIPSSARDRTEAAVMRAIKTVQHMPGVRFTGIDAIDPASPEYRQPADGTGFTSWHLFPANAIGAQVDPTGTEYQLSVSTIDIITAH
jgi:hypothetical protein